MLTGAGSDKERIAERGEAGFSLVEPLVVLSIIMTMTGITVMGMGSYRGKVTERQTRNIADALLLAQNSQEVKPGVFRAELCQEDHTWVLVVRRTLNPEAHGGTVWTEYDRQELGSANSLRISDGEGRSLQSDSSGCYYHWGWDRESGACTEGAGSIILSGSGKSYRLTVYEPTGRAQVRTVYQ